VKTRGLFVLLCIIAALTCAVLVLHLRLQSPIKVDVQYANDGAAVDRSDSLPALPLPSMEIRQKSITNKPHDEISLQQSPSLAKTVPSTNKVERLAELRESFRTLAQGDPASAMRAAKLLTDETERETALLTLVTEWTQGELRPARKRATAISDYGIEAGLGMELSKRPELALAWANELTDGSGRAAILGQVAAGMADADPASAFVLGEQLPQLDKRKFFDVLFSSWAEEDTSAAIEGADQLGDAAAKEAALQAIRTVAPVGIGAALAIQDGYPVINGLIPGTPAEQSGQLHAGDRIIALAQGDNAYVDMRSLPLQDVVQMIRGAPNSLVQLQVISADAPPNSSPRVVAIVRDQLKFKR